MKRIPALAIALLSLFILGSCDAILETLYPDATIGGGGGGDVVTTDYSVAVTVEYVADLIDIGFGYQNTGAIPIKVALIPFDSNFQILTAGIQYKTVWQNTFTQDDYGRVDTTLVTFDAVDTKIYKVLAWLDEGNDDLFDTYGTLAQRDDASTIKYVDFRYIDPSNAGVDMSCRIGTAYHFDNDELMANPFGPTAVIDHNAGSSSVPAGTTVIFNRTGSTALVGHYISDEVWKITNSLGVEKTSRTDPTFSYLFDTAETYTITLKVQDDQMFWSKVIAFTLIVTP